MAVFALVDGAFARAVATAPEEGQADVFMAGTSQTTVPSWSLSPAEWEALRAVVQGTASSTGDEYFRDLVQHLAEAVGTHHAFVSEFTPPQRIRTLAFWSNGKIVPNIEYDLPGTPCQEVINGDFCFYASGLQAKYPETEPGIESYLGVALKAKDGRILGHLCVLDERPLDEKPAQFAVFQIFAARAAAELDRIRLEDDLRIKEEHLRDLFDEAPIAYVHETLDTRFLRANRAAMRILGIQPDEVQGMVGRSLIPDTPDAQRRLSEAFTSVGEGTDTAGVVLELRRKDDGRPIWIQWWSKPDPSGLYTRTMFVDITDRILMEREQARLLAQNTYLREEIKATHNFDEIIGASGGLLKVLGNVQRVAPTEATVMITGETGTGKELIARAIHSASDRADGPFIKVNCAALPASLVESELFGHERGAFSGAIQRRVGRFELANRGTIFLDEIGEVPMEVQVKLLRVLQEREFERVGGNQTIHTDVRVIAATNRDLQRSIAEGSFRADLYYRLNVFPLALPPLRERGEDIPLLVQFFIQKYANRVGRRVDAVDGGTMKLLLDYHWPGNIRELENIIERALILSSSSVLQIDPDTLARPAVPVMPAHEDLASASSSHIDSVMREHIVTALNDTSWIIEGERGAARRLGIKPGTLRHRMKKLGIARGRSQLA
jgi:PAS domain S-box-containing protein